MRIPRGDITRHPIRLISFLPWLIWLGLLQSLETVQSINDGGQRGDGVISKEGLVLKQPSSGGGAQTDQYDEEKTNTCSATSTTDCYPYCNGDSSYGSGFKIFDYGTAQTYKPHQPIQSTICDPKLYSATISTTNTDNTSKETIKDIISNKQNTQSNSRRKNTKYLVATWPFSRSRRRSSVPIKLNVRLFSCGNMLLLSSNSSSSTRTSPSGGRGAGGQKNNIGRGTINKENLNTGVCQCQPFDIVMQQLPNNMNTNYFGVMDIWQTRPDGSYTSLRPGVADGDCRARIILGKRHKQSVVNISNPIEFYTMAPGSTGALGGLGPNRLDFMPYGPPVIHVLVMTSHHVPALMNIPIVVGKNNEQTSFVGPDWRGPAWVQPRQGMLKKKDKESNNKKQQQSTSSSYPLFNLTVWNSNSKTNAIEIEVEIYLQQQQDIRKGNNISSDTDDESLLLSYSSHVATLCQSWFYGFPSSFFMEPITLCAPSMLDFFAL